MKTPSCTQLVAPRPRASASRPGCIAVLATIAVALPAAEPTVVQTAVFEWRDQYQWVERPLTGRDDTVPGEVSAPHPTLINLALEWRIDGDDNLDGTVTVAYRRAGTSRWLEALPLRRVPPGTFKDRDPKRSFFSWENKHAGSIVDLQPDTEYEIALRLRDPDGGSAETTLRACTRAEPHAMPGARIVPVTVKNIADEAARAEPGDVLLLAPGNYGFFHAPRDGEPGKPIVFRANPNDVHEWKTAGGGTGRARQFVLFNGFSLAGRKHVHLEGVLSTDTIDLFNAENCAVQRCTVHALWGIVSGWSEAYAQWMPQLVARLPQPPDMRAFIGREQPGEAIPPHSRDCTIADNIVVGVNAWSPEAIHADGKNLGEGIEINGPGNVVCHNRVTGFRDCISSFEGPKAFAQDCVDIYNNDISAGADDGIEADYFGANGRIMRNRITNCMRGIALAPVLGGPVYVVRNVLYNTENIWQFGRAGSGYVALHNTSVKAGTALTLESHTHSFVRNNLFTGGGDRARPLVRTVGEASPGRDFDYDGYGAEGVPFAGNFAGVAFDSIESLRAATTEKHCVRVGLDIFTAAVRIPAGLFPAQPPADLRLRGDSTAIDAGVPLPGINDTFTGRAPDLGAYESDAEMPIYGPRPVETD